MIDSVQSPQTVLEEYNKNIKQIIKDLHKETDRYYKLKKKHPAVNYDKYIHPIEYNLFTHETDLIFIQKYKNDIIAKIQEYLNSRVRPNDSIRYAIEDTKEKVGYVQPTNEKAEKRDRAILINDLTTLYTTPLQKDQFRPFFRDDKTNTNIRNSIFTFVNTYLDKAKSRREKGHFEHFGGNENDPVDKAIKGYKFTSNLHNQAKQLVQKAHILFDEFLGKKTYENIESHLEKHYKDYFNKVINWETDEIAELKEYIAKFMRGLIEEPPPASRYVEEFGGGALKKSKKKAARGKVHIGPRGGKYVLHNGRKVYV